MDCIDHGMAGDKDGYGSTCAHQTISTITRNIRYKEQVGVAQI
uniref:Uncharacterized protein n=2 Tax=Viruses TaxID=10239 RepID=A0AAU8KWC0_9CAUD